jgi:hypothetical protein
MRATRLPARRAHKVAHGPAHSLSPRGSLPNGPDTRSTTWNHINSSILRFRLPDDTPSRRSKLSVRNSQQPLARFTNLGEGLVAHDISECHVLDDFLQSPNACIIRVPSDGDQVDGRI